MILNDWLRGNIPYFLPPPATRDQPEVTTTETISVAQELSRIVVHSDFSKEDLVGDGSMPIPPRIPRSSDSPAEDEEEMNVSTSADDPAGALQEADIKTEQQEEDVENESLAWSDLSSYQASTAPTTGSRKRKAPEDGQEPSDVGRKRRAAEKSAGTAAPPVPPSSRSTSSAGHKTNTATLLATGRQRKALAKPTPAVAAGGAGDVSDDDDGLGLSKPAAAPLSASRSVPPSVGGKKQRHQEKVGFSLR